MKSALTVLACLVLSGCAADSDGWVTPLKNNRGALVTLRLNGWGGAHIVVLTPSGTAIDRYSFSTTPWRGKAAFRLRRDFDRRDLSFALVEKSRLLEFEGQEWPLGGNNVFLLVLDQDLTGQLKPLSYRSRGIYGDEILDEVRKALPDETLLKSLYADMDHVRGLN